MAKIENFSTFHYLNIRLIKFLQFKFSKKGDIKTEENGEFVSMDTHVQSTCYIKFIE